MTDATNSIHNPNSVIDRIASVLALQHRLGLLSQRRNGANLGDRLNSRPVRTDLDDLAGGNTLRRERLFQGDRRLVSAAAAVPRKNARFVPTNALVTGKSIHGDAVSPASPA